MQDIEGTVLDIIARKTGADRADLTRETELSNLKFDSVDTIEVVFEIEEAFNTSLMINANSFITGEINTVGDVIDLVSSSQNAPANASGPTDHP